MLENFEEKTASFILETTTQCFEFFDEAKKTCTDKTSREYFEKLKWAKKNIEVLLSQAKSQSEKPLKDVVVGNEKFNFKRVKDEVFNLMFLFLKIKNLNCKLSEKAKNAAELLNKNLCAN